MIFQYRDVILLFCSYGGGLREGVFLLATGVGDGGEASSSPPRVRECWLSLLILEEYCVIFTGIPRQTQNSSTWAVRVRSTHTFLRVNLEFFVFLSVQSSFAATCRHLGSLVLCHLAAFSAAGDVAIITALKIDGVFFGLCGSLLQHVLAVAAVTP